MRMSVISYSILIRTTHVVYITILHECILVRAWMVGTCRKSVSRLISGSWHLALREGLRPVDRLKRCVYLNLLFMSVLCSRQYLTWVRSSKILLRVCSFSKGLTSHRNIHLPNHWREWRTIPPHSLHLWVGSRYRSRFTPWKDLYRSSVTFKTICAVCWISSQCSHGVCFDETAVSYQ